MEINHTADIAASYKYKNKITKKRKNKNPHNNTILKIVENEMKSVFKETDGKHHKIEKTADTEWARKCP